MHPRRLTRLNELILQTVSEALLRLKDPLPGFVTVTGAETSPDVTLVKIFYSVFGNEKQVAETIDALTRMKPKIRYQVGQLENLRRVPDLMFVFDESVERANRVHQILKTIHEEEKGG